jgi:hypothetical protein
MYSLKTRDGTRRWTVTGKPGLRKNGVKKFMSEALSGEKFE